VSEPSESPLNHPTFGSDRMASLGVTLEDFEVNPSVALKRVQKSLTAIARIRPNELETR